jgi:hypothetical protein
MFGTKCLFIHPNIPCKFGFYCTRLGCAYSHPAGYSPGMYPPPNMMHGHGMPMYGGGHSKFKNMKIDHSGRGAPRKALENPGTEVNATKVEEEIPTNMNMQSDI